MISEEMVIARKNMSRRMRSKTKLTCRSDGGGGRIFQSVLHSLLILDS